MAGGGGGGGAWASLVLPDSAFSGVGGRSPGRFRLQRVPGPPPGPCAAPERPLPRILRHRYLGS